MGATVARGTLLSMSPIAEVAVVALLAAQVGLAVMVVRLLVRLASNQQQSAVNLEAADKGRHEDVVDTASTLLAADEGRQITDDDGESAVRTSTKQ